jgi:hypothetical protein
MRLVPDILVDKDPTPVPLTLRTHPPTTACSSAHGPMRSTAEEREAVKKLGSGVRSITLPDFTELLVWGMIMRVMDGCQEMYTAEGALVEDLVQ